MYLPRPRLIQPARIDISLNIQWRPPEAPNKRRCAALRCSALTLQQSLQLLRFKWFSLYLIFQFFNFKAHTHTHTQKVWLYKHRYICILYIIKVPRIGDVKFSCICQIQLYLLLAVSCVSQSLLVSMCVCVYAKAPNAWAVC